MRVLSCQGLNLIENSCSWSLISKKSKGVTLSISVRKVGSNSSSSSNENDDVYRSRVDDDDGAGNGGVLRIPVDCSLCWWLEVEIYRNRKRRMIGWCEEQVGWCVIPASDINALVPPSSLQFLSYRLRARDGSTTPAIINLSIQFNPATVIGIPVKHHPWLWLHHPHSTKTLPSLPLFWFFKIQTCFVCVHCCACYQSQKIQTPL